MRRSRLPAVVLIAILAVLASSVSGVVAHDREHAGDAAPAAGSFVVTGNVEDRLRLSVADLTAMPGQRTVEVTYRAGAGIEHHVFTGTLPLDVLAGAVPRFDPAIKNDKLRHLRLGHGVRRLPGARRLRRARSGVREQADPARDDPGRRLARRPGAAPGRARRHRRRALRDRRRPGPHRQATPLTQTGDEPR